jgi:hypothetical protein
MAKKQTELAKPDLEQLLADANAKEEAQKVDCAALKSLSKSELIAIIERINAAMGNVAVMDDNTIAEAMLLKLATNALTTKDAKDCLANVNAWLDRKHGKPQAVVAVTGGIQVEIVRYTDAPIPKALSNIIEHEAIEHGGGA